MAKEIEIPEGYEAKIENNKVIFVPKESDDERVRKAIISALNGNGQATAILKNKGVYWGDAIAWLEKRKEQKPEYEHVDVPGIAKPDYGICDDYIPATLHTAMVKHGWYAGHIREDEKFVLKRKEEVARNWPADKDNLTQDKPVEKHDLVAQLEEHLANTPKEQLEAEWKELEKWSHVGPAVEEYLHSIKPAEWSEKDREDVELIAEHLDNLGNTAMAEFLRNLRPQPHWKPSEEQISALEYFIRVWGESGSMSPQNPVLCAAKSLLTDLQKLL